MDSVSRGGGMLAGADPSAAVAALTACSIGFQSDTTTLTCRRIDETAAPRSAADASDMGGRWMAM